MKSQAIPDSQKWQAVVDKDATFDGLFFYGVYSTGVVCKPSCPSKPKRKDSVVFFQTLEEAQKSGFRPCLRCHPDALEQPSQFYVQQAMDLLQHEDIPLAKLASQTPWTPTHFQKIFKQLVGLSPKQFALQEKHKKAHLAFAHDKVSITQAIFDAGFHSLSRFYESSPLGLNPSQLKAGARGLCLDYTTFQTDLGWVLLARTKKGLCCALLGDHAKEVLEAFQERFPQASIHDNPVSLQPWKEQVEQWILSPPTALSIPLDVQGTTFQKKIWSLLQAIPPGETRSYQAISAQLGNPKASRAVAKACGANPVALVIPCHRVIRQTGELSGYRWGVERKKALLDKEQKFKK